MLTTTHNNRVFTLTAVSVASLTNLASDMELRGWTPEFFNGVSEPTGRQRKTVCQVFFRNAKTGSFVAVNVA